MKSVRRITALLLVLLLCAGILGGCGNGDTDDTTTAVTGENTDTAQPRVLKLPYAKAEPLNPFKATSLINIQLGPLLYDTLFAVDKNYKAQPVLAADYTADGLTIKVNIKPGITFTDGAALTADDVVYSFKQAQTSAAFSARLTNFSSARKQSETSVAFYLKSLDPYAVNCLGFAVVKNNDNTDVPTGSGRYTFSEKNGRHYLDANPVRLGGFSPSIKTIVLADVADSDALNYSLQIGNVDFLFTTLSDGSYRRINASAVEVGMNNLVFLAFNSATAKLQSTEIRQAISLLVDRQSLAATPFQGHARAAFSPFNPDFAVDADYTFSADPQGAVKLLETAGYSKLNSSGVRYSGSNSTLTFSLLVNAGNAFKTQTAQFIAKALMEVGIKVNVSEMELDDYLAAVQSGRFDIYIGEMLLTPNMSLTPLLAPGGSVSYGVNTATGEASSAYRQFLNGTLDLKGFVDVFNKDLPFVPLCYRNGVAGFSRELKIPGQFNVSDIYSDIQTWSF